MELWQQQRTGEALEESTKALLARIANSLWSGDYKYDLWLNIPKTIDFLLKIRINHNHIVLVVEKRPLPNPHKTFSPLQGMDSNMI